MPPRMTKQSAGRSTTTPRGGRTDRQTGRGCGRTRESRGRGNGQTSEPNNQGVEANRGVDGVPDFFIIIAQQLQNLLPTILAQVGNQGNNQGINRNQNDDVVNDNIHIDVRNVIVNNDRMGYTYKELLACHPKEYDGKGGMVAATEPTIIQKAVQKAGTLTDEAIRNRSLKRNPDRRGNGGEPSRDRNGKDDNKRTRTGNAFATTANPVRREYHGAAPKCENLTGWIHTVNIYNI
ncbi:hypothetical protein Tco_1521146 [Tanacetum coccineum]